MKWQLSLVYGFELAMAVSKTDTAAFSLCEREGNGRDSCYDL